MRILMLEDQARDARLVEHALKEAGFSFAFKRAENKAQFLDELEHFHPSVILSDSGLPSFDGFSALQLAKEKAPNVPFIFVTGSLGDEMTVEALKNGASDCILKKKLNCLPSALHRALRQADDNASRKRAEEELKQLNVELENRVAERTAELEDANKELEAFSYSVSHDLRAPLRHIEGFVEILLSTAATQLEEESQKHLARISDAAKQMAQLIDDLLAFSRTARADLIAVRIPLGELFAATFEDLVSREQPERKVEFVLPDLPEVHADLALLRQVVLNLLTNAIKYTRTQADPRIEVGSKSSRKEHVIFVRDNGVGFDPRYTHKLFGVFQRLHSSTQFEGTGVGLANVRRIIHRHGGRTWAEGEINKGATFYFSLPRQPATPSAAAAEPRPEKTRENST